MDNAEEFEAKLNVFTVHELSVLPSPIVITDHHQSTAFRLIALDSTLTADRTTANTNPWISKSIDSSH